MKLQKTNKILETAIFKKSLIKKFCEARKVDLRNGTLHSFCLFVKFLDLLNFHFLSNSYSSHPIKKKNEKIVFIHFVINFPYSCLFIYLSVYLYVSNTSSKFIFPNFSYHFKKLVFF
jgi:hypothetical protein